MDVDELFAIVSAQQLDMPMIDGVGHPDIHR